MAEPLIRQARSADLEACVHVESAGFPPEEAASPETIQLRLETFPEGFLVAEIDGQVVGLLNSAATNKEDLSDETLKQMVGHETGGRHLVVFSLAVLPAYRKQGLARQLMAHFAAAAARSGRDKILLLCKQPLIRYYASLGFEHVGLSRSTHGGAEWHEMCLPLPKP